MQVLEELASQMVLGALLERLREHAGSYELCAHWKQGEFHHDVVVRAECPGLPGEYLVIATNCNGGVKEVLCLAEMPERGGLWRRRCPQNPEFEGALPDVLERRVTSHWFDPCELLLPDARSELKQEYRERQPGGGWRQR